MSGPGARDAERLALELGNLAYDESVTLPFGMDQNLLNAAALLRRLAAAAPRAGVALPDREALACALWMQRESGNPADWPRVSKMKASAYYDTADATLVELRSLAAAPGGEG